MRDAAALVLFASRHYAYYLWPSGQQGDVFNIIGALTLIAGVLWLRIWWPLTAWIVSEELLVAGCSVWALIDVQGLLAEEQCSARIGFKLGSIGLCVLAGVAYRFATCKTLLYQETPKD